MALPTLDDEDLLGCKNIRQEFASNIIPLPIPTGTAQETELFDMLGVIETISVEGSYGDTVANLKTFADSLFALSNKEQTGTIIFNSDQTGSVSVMISSIDVNWEIPGTHISWSVKLLIGTAG